MFTLPRVRGAESYGFISALLFLQAYTQYSTTPIDPSTTHDFYCDSESLLNSQSLESATGWGPETEMIFFAIFGDLPPSVGISSFFYLLTRRTKVSAI